MTDFKGIRGWKVQTLSTDPVASGITGGTWASGGDLNAPKGFTGRTGAGPQTAAQAAAGFTSPGGAIGTVEHYDGSSWTETTDVNTARSAATHGGTQTSSLITGGNTALSVTEEWNGSAWTEVNDLNTGRRQLAMSTNGNAEGAIAFGGYAPPTPGPIGYTGRAEEWDGSSWTEVSDLNTSRSSLTATDQSSTAALGIAGYRGPPTADRTKFVEEWNGSAWTEIADVNRERMDLGCGGSYTDCIIFAGVDGPTPFLAVTEHWDGSSWTEIADMSTVRCEVGGTGASTAGLAFGGTTPPYTNVTEEFTAATVFSKITEGQLYFNSTTNTFKETVFDIPGATWASGGNKNNPSRNNAAFGTQTATVSAGESGGSTSNKTEEYDGTSWTEVNNLPAALASNSGAGVLTSGSSFGGSPTVTEQYIYDGTNWTDGADLNSGRHAAGAAGTSSTSAMMFGGHPPNLALTEVYDGSSWSEKNDLNYGRQLLCGVGTVTAALAIGGSGPGPDATPNQSELWDGVSWTSAGSLPVNVYGNAGSGTSTLSIAMGGLPPSTDTNANMRSTQFWNGASWSEVAEMATSRASAQGTGSALAGFVIGGYNPLNAPGYDNDANKTEEWTVDLANKTITAS